MVSVQVNISVVGQFFEMKCCLFNYMNRIGRVMVNVLGSSVIDRVFEPRSGQTKHYKMYVLLLR